MSYPKILSREEDKRLPIIIDYSDFLDCVCIKDVCTFNGWHTFDRQEWINQGGE